MKKRQALRNFCITSWDTSVYKTWTTLKDERIRLLSWQLEDADKPKETAGLEPAKLGAPCIDDDGGQSQYREKPKSKIHVQAYLETYEPLRLKQIKNMLGCNSIHIDVRNGPRLNAYMYTKKEDTPWWDINYPQWIDHGKRVPGTEHRQLGTFSNRQGQRTELLRVIDSIEQGATENDIAMSAPREYIKYPRGIKALLQQHAFKRKNVHNKIKVHIRYGETRSHKTRYVYDKYTPQGVDEPVWNGTKYWYDGYDGQKVCMFNEFTGNTCSIEYLLHITDDYYRKIETKGGMTVHNWDEIYFTSNVHPSEWFNSWEGIPQEQQDAFLQRIDTITHCVAPPERKKKSWDSIPIQEYVADPLVLPKATSVPSSIPLKEDVFFSTPAIFTYSSGRPETNGEISVSADHPCKKTRTEGEVETAKACCRNSPKNRSRNS